MYSLRIRIYLGQKYCVLCVARCDSHSSRYKNEISIIEIATPQLEHMILFFVFFLFFFSKKEKKKLSTANTQDQHNDKEEKEE